ncbi:MAG: hypothetical protein QOH50_5236 [Kribbellaceae bacterium]|nr:hypothetical protein [Kribbellaceae bacterium]
MGASLLRVLLDGVQGGFPVAGYEELVGAGGIGEGKGVGVPLVEDGQEELEVVAGRCRARCPCRGGHRVWKG